ncbi:hypothetical protein DM01DRAFT_1408461 [Hesseltinella vesiculosa]|uniref:MMS19 nucleotide excision repair protein n=1 Tax=Hesseltinella vesiculosa TaxID=101127 RepID=A0A1X2GEN4_9FUNG|nr:hypothetical protein DM01DRAFT_1408461 [Hesseltinella vesiculosa]
MEHNGRSRFCAWMQEPDLTVTPSLLASVLLYVSKAPQGLSSFLDLLNETWPSMERDQQHEQCLSLLSKVITPCLSTINYHTVADLFEFMNNTGTKDRLVPAWVDILVQIVSADLCNTDQCMATCQWLFHHLPPLKSNQPVRFKALTILGHIVHAKSQDISQTLPNFIDDYLSIMDGEKDPRNLLLAFDLVRLIIDKFDISRHVEELFDIVFCYFPISFSPSPNDPLAITSDDLKLSLRQCLAATPYFAYYATPVLIEKLISTSGSAKKDVMDTIRLCAAAYGAHALLPHAQDLFGALVKEVYHGSDASMSALSLDTIHQVVATLATGVSIDNIRDPVERAIAGLLQEALEHLKAPELRHAKSASSILRAAASASDPACALVVNAVVPLLYEDFNLSNPLGRQKAVLGYLIDLLEANNSLYGSVDSTEKDRDLQTPLAAYKQRLFQIFVTSLIHDQQADTELHYLYFTGIRLMVIMKRFLTADEIDLTVMQLTRQLFYPDKSIQQLLSSTLTILAKQNPQIIQEHTIPLLLDQLKSRQKPYQEILGFLQAVAVDPSLFCQISSDLWIELSSMAKQPETLMYAEAIASSLCHLLDNIVMTDKVLQLCQQTFVPSILNETIKSTLHEPDSWCMNPSLLHSLASIVARTVRSSPDVQQAQVMDRAFQVFINGDLQLMQVSTVGKVDDYLLYGTCSMDKAEQQTDRCSRDMTLLFPVMIGNCRKDIHLPVHDLHEFLGHLMEHSLVATCHARQLAMNASIAIIVNKWVDDDMETFLKKTIQQRLTPLLEASQGSFATRRSALACFIWMTKGLVVRGHPLGLAFVDDLLHLCRAATDLQMEAANGLATLLQQDELVLNRSCHANVSILYRQRLFHHCLPKLTVDHYHACLVALSHLLVNIPTQVPMADMPKLIPSLVTAFESQDEDLILSMIQVAKTIAPQALHEPEHIKTMIGRLLPLTYKHDRSLIRLNALECLAAFARVESTRTRLDPAFVRQITRSLGRALDDKKRRVRREAVICRDLWYKVPMASSF